MPVLHFLAFPFLGITYCLPSMENVMLKSWVLLCEHLGLPGSRFNHEPSDAFPRQVSSMPGMRSQGETRHWASTPLPNGEASDLLTDGEKASWREDLI